MPDATIEKTEAAPKIAPPQPLPPNPDIGPVPKTNPELQTIFGKLRTKAGVEAPPKAKEEPKPEPKKEVKKSPIPVEKADPAKGTRDAEDEPSAVDEDSTDKPTTGEDGDVAELASDSGGDDKLHKVGDKAATEGADKDKKSSPWKLVRQYESRTRELERELAEVKKGNGAANPQEVKELKERLQAVEAKNKEYVEALRFHDYEKYDPKFQADYDKPYRDAFSRAVAEISELNITGPDGEQRPATAQDMLDLVQLPLAKAKPLAKQMFGEDFADDAMHHRATIKSVFDARQRALEEARTGLDAQQKQRAQEFEAKQSEVSKFVNETWEKATRDSVTDEKFGKYFAPREADPDWNQRLAKGLELVDRAFNAPNPMDPTLTKEQRQSVIKLHAAVRSRAAGWGPLRNAYERQATRIEELEAQLAEYQESEPKPGVSEKTPPKDTGPMDPMERMLQGIRKFAK